MADGDDALFQALCPCGADVVLPDRLQHGGAGHAGDHRQGVGAEGDGRQHQSAPGLKVGGWEPPQPRCEDHDQHQPQPEVRHGDAEQSAHHGDVVHRRILMGGGDHAQGNSDQNGKKHGAGRQQDGIGQPGGDLRRHRVAGAV